MTQTTTARSTNSARLALDDIDAGENARPLDPDNVAALTASIKLRGLLVPLIVRPVDGRHQVVAGHHRLAACRELGHTEIDVIIRDHEGSSADSACENITRKQLTPLEPSTVALDATFVGSAGVRSHWIAGRRAATAAMLSSVSLSCKRKGFWEQAKTDATLLR